LKITSKIIKPSKAEIVSITLKMAKNDIIQELSELGSSFTDIPARDLYFVPQGYFEELAGLVMSRIRAVNSANPREELTYLSPFLQAIPRELPFSVPEGYFQNLPETLMESIRKHEDYQTAEEELSSLSPLLNGIGNKNPYAVPEGYFENFGKDVNLKPVSKPAAKVVSMVHRKWFRFAAAAVVIGFIAMTGVLLFFSDGPIRISSTHKWVEENMNKVSTDEINSFIQADEQATASAKGTDIRELMKDVSDNDIQDFLGKTNASNDENDGDLLLN
jgi:hypothetical protein